MAGISACFCSAQDAERFEGLEVALLSTVDDSAKVRLLLELADRLDNTEPEKALAYTLQGLSLCERHHWDAQLAEFQLEVIFLYRRPLVNYPKAIAQAQALMETSHTLHSDRYRAEALAEFGIIFKEMNDFSKAIEHLDSSLRICRRIHYATGVGDCLRFLAHSHLSLNDTTAARTCFEQNVKEMLAYGDSTQLCNAIIDLAGFHLSRSGPETALTHLSRAIRIAQLRSRPETITSHGEVGRVQFHAIEAMIGLQLARADRAGARHYADSLLLRAREWDDDGQLLRAYRISGQALELNGRTLLAIERYDSSLMLAVDLNNRHEEALCLERLFQAYESVGDQANALRSIRRLMILKDSLQAAEKDVEATRIISRMDLAQRTLADSLAHAHELTLKNAEVRKQKLVRNGFVGGFALVALFAAVFLFQRNRIGTEKKRSDELLLNILPAEVAEELKENGSAKAREFERATILFTDFKGFTSISEQLTPAELVDELNTCFMVFDRIVTQRGIEKIKTIGDAYMAVGGLPDPRTSTAADVVHAALEMQDFMTARKAERDAQGLPAFQMRAGIHTGPVVAGIVGVKKFAYDIWGDTVNTASRLESSGEVGRVNISEATYRLVVGCQLPVVGQDHSSQTTVNGQPTTDNRQLTTDNRQPFRFTPRGTIPAKGKGELSMYFVDRVPTG